MNVFEIIGLALLILLAALLSRWLIISLGLSAWVAIPIAVLSAAIVGWILGKVMMSLLGRKIGQSKISRH